MILKLEPFDNIVVYLSKIFHRQKFYIVLAQKYNLKKWSRLPKGSKSKYPYSDFNSQLLL